MHGASFGGYSSEISDPLVVTVALPSISGKVTGDLGQGIEDALVKLTGAETRTAIPDVFGNYSFTNLTAGGSYTITPEAIGYAFTPASQSYANLTASQIRNFDGVPSPATYTVNVTHDAGDGVCTLAECTLREAIAAANAHTGADTIGFSIPGAGPHVLPLAAGLPALQSDLVIDGYTQPGAFPNTNATGGLNGAIDIALQRDQSVPSGITGLTVAGSRITIRGLAIGGFAVGIRLIPTPVPRDVVIAGNYLGTTADGLSAMSGGFVGVRMDRGAGLTLGGSTPAARNLIAGYSATGVDLIAGYNGQAANVVVRGNLIGTDVTGQAALPNAVGLSYTDQALQTPQADVLLIGGDAPGEANVISGNTGIGLKFYRGTGSDRDDSDQQTIGNLIGVAADGVTPLGNGGDAGVDIGGRVTHRLARNTIAHNSGVGVWVFGDPTATWRGIELTENRIFANGGVAIGLSINTRGPNDPGDSDGGPNGFQDHPMLTSMIETLAGATLTGTLNSQANRVYRIELFTTGSLPSAGMHARAFIGSFEVTTDANGDAPLTHVFTTAFAATERFSATATDVESRMTSELSADVMFVPDARADVTASVTLNGSPLGGVNIAVTGDRQITQPTLVDGTRTFSLPVGGSYVLTPSLAGYLFTPSSATVPTLAAAATVAFTARLQAFTRYLPEGATGGFWKTSIAVLNAGAAATTADVSFLLQDGTKTAITVPLTAPGHVVIDPSTIDGLGSAAFSTVISAPEPLVVSRTMRWGEHGELGAHAEQALSEPRTSWYFAEGTTGCFDLFYLLVNPGATPAEVDVTFVRRAPLAPIVKHYQVGAFSRATIEVNGVEGLDAAEVSGRIDVANDQPIVAERAMYSRCFGEVWRGGHGGVASAAPSTNWFFAEGATGSFFDLYLLLANFNAQPAAVEIAYLLDNGSTVTKTYDVPGGSRVTIDVANEGPELAQAAVSAIVRSTNAVPVVAERAQWWPHGGWYEGHVSAGVTAAGIEWQIAGVEVGGAMSSEAFLLIANTASGSGSAQVRVIYGDGTSETLSEPVALGPNSRTTLSLREVFPNTTDRVFGVVVESLGATPAPIVVELSTYGNTPATAATPARLWGAGTNMVATRVR